MLQQIDVLRAIELERQLQPAHEYILRQHIKTPQMTMHDDVLLWSLCQYLVGIRTEWDNWILLAIPKHRRTEKKTLPYSPHLNAILMQSGVGLQKYEWCDWDITKGELNYILADPRVARRVVWHLNDLPSGHLPKWLNKGILGHINRVAKRSVTKYGKLGPEYRFAPTWPKEYIIWIMKLAGLDTPEVAEHPVLRRTRPGLIAESRKPLGRMAALMNQKKHP